MLLENLTAAQTPHTPPSTTASWSPQSKAYIYAFLAFVTVTVRGLVELRHYHLARRIGMRSGSELTMAIFEKALTRKDMSGRTATSAASINDEKRKENASVGKVISLISEDVNRVLRMGCDGHQLYGAPLEILLGLLSLYEYVSRRDACLDAYLMDARAVSWGRQPLLVSSYCR
jgi:hypothetical protein